MIENKQDQQLKLMLAVIRSINFSHPIIYSACKEICIDPDDLKPKKLEFFIDKKTCAEVHELRFRHYEARRKAKLELVAFHLLKSGVDYQVLINTEISKSLPKRRSLSPDRADKISQMSKLEKTVNQRITTHDLSHKKYMYEKKKLDRLLKVLGNIKQKKIEDEAKKVQIFKDFDHKQKKIEAEKMNCEEKRIKKINEVQAKRQEILKKKQTVNYI